MISHDRKMNNMGISLRMRLQIVIFGKSSVIWIFDFRVFAELEFKKYRFENVSSLRKIREKIEILDIFGSKSFLCSRICFGQFCGFCATNEIGTCDSILKFFFGSIIIYFFAKSVSPAIVFWLTLTKGS